MKTTWNFTNRVRRLKRAKRGSALVLVMVFVLTFSIAIASIVSFTGQQTRDTYRTRTNVQSMEGAHATLQQVTNNVMHIANTVASTTVRPPTQLGGEMTNLNTIINDIAPVAFDGTRFVNTEDGTPLTYIQNRGENDFSFTERTAPDDPWRGYSTARFEYEIVSFMQEDSNRPELLGVRGGGVKNRVTIDYIPLYQFAIFYNGDLELHPGANMQVRGRVHTNRNLYLSTSATLDFHERVSATGQFRRFRAEAQGGNVRINDGRNPGGLNLVSMDLGGGEYLEHPSSDWLNRSVTRWNNYVRDRDHGVTPILPPLPNGVTNPRAMISRVQATDPPDVREIRFEYQADVIVTGDPGNPSTIRAYKYTKDDDGNITGRQEYSDVGQFVKIGRFYDGQQLTIVRTLDIMMDELLLHPAGEDLANGLGMLYVSTTPGMLDNYVLSSNNMDPTYLRDAAGNIQYNGVGKPMTVPQGQGGTEGWLRPAQKNMAGGQINFTNEYYKPAVRITNRVKNADQPQRLQNPVRFPRNTSNGFGFYTDRPLYVAGDRVNTADKATLVLGADAITATAFEQTLAVRDRGVVTGTHPNISITSTTGNNILDSDASGALIINGHTRDMGNAWNNGTASFTNQNIYSWEQNNTTDSRDNAIRAMNSTINAILLIGNVPSLGDPGTPPGQTGTITQQSGGAHNVIRYNERWNGITHTINGSIICLYESAVAVQHNRGGPKYTAHQNYYAAPNRNYIWDGSLRNSTPPPGMPIVVQINRSPVEMITLDYALSNMPTP